jgi:CubicO group peptidase (beta-lactamase class C family)
MIDVAGFIQAADDRGLELHSLIVQHRGETVAERWWHPFKPEYPHYLYSLSKSFCSTAIGLLISEGKLSLDTRVVDVFPDKLPASPSERLGRLTVRHLLTMAMGQNEDGLFSIIKGSDDWMRSLLARDFTHEPGSNFSYDSGATYACSAIHHRITGEGLVEYLTPRLFEPLAIDEAVWLKDPQGIDIGGVGLSLTTRSIAKFGQLLLQRGTWDGKQLVPAEWIDLATSKQIDNSGNWSADWSCGYGFQFWQCTPPETFRGDGAFGQVCLVDRANEIVVAITSCIDDFQLLLTTCYEFLTQCTGIAEMDCPRLPSGDLQLPEGTAQPDEGSLGAFDIAEVSAEKLKFGGGDYDIGKGWTDAEFDPWLKEATPVSTALAWKSPTELEMRIQQLTYPANTRLTFTFEGDMVKVKAKVRGMLLPDEHVEDPLVGHRVVP